MLSLSDILFYVAIPILFVYFFLFNKTIKMLEPPERTRYIKEAGSIVNILITITLFVALAYFDDFKVKLTFAFLIAAYMVIGTIFHHKKLKVLNFESAFERRLLQISYISGFGIILILGSIVLN